MVEMLFRNPDLCNDEDVASDLLEHFQRGYPIENLRRFLASDNPKIVETGCFIASELGVRAAPLLLDIARLLHHVDPVVRYQAIDSMLVNGSGAQGREMAIVVRMLEAFEEPIRRKVMNFLWRASPAQILGALQYFEETQPMSPHVSGLRWLMDSTAFDADRIASALESTDSLVLRYAAVVAARIANSDIRPLRGLASSKDKELALFAKDTLDLL
jgi:hypothetical protein